MKNLVPSSLPPRECFCRLLIFPNWVKNALFDQEAIDFQELLKTMFVSADELVLSFLFTNFLFSLLWDPMILTNLFWIFSRVLSVSTSLVFFFWIKYRLISLNRLLLRFLASGVHLMWIPTMYCLLYTYKMIQYIIYH